MKYTKKHTTEKALWSHVEAIEERKGYWVVKNSNNGWLLTYWFDDIDFKMVNIDTFNKSIKPKLKSIINEYENNLAEINNHISFLFIRKIIDAIGSNPPEIRIKNSSKNPVNHFQYQVEIGNIVLYAVFVYVNDKHQVDASRCNIQLLDSDYETIKVLIKD